MTRAARAILGLFAIALLAWVLRRQATATGELSSHPPEGDDGVQVDAGLSRDLHGVTVYSATTHGMADGGNSDRVVWGPR